MAQQQLLFMCTVKFIKNVNIIYEFLDNKYVNDFYIYVFFRTLPVIQLYIRRRMSDDNICTLRQFSVYKGTIKLY